MKRIKLLNKKNMETLELKFGDSTITLIPEKREGIWTVSPPQLQIDNGDDESYIDLDRDAIDQLIVALEKLRL